MVVEVIALRRLYERDHLDQVLATFGLILFFNELVRLIWGPEGLLAAAAVLAHRLGAAPAGRALSGLPAVDHRRRRSRSPASSTCW